MPKPEYVDTGAGEPNKLERLWAPYRMSYIAENPDPVENNTENGEVAEPSDHDPFVKIPQGDDEAGLIIARGTFCFVCLNLYPYNPGHAMVIPYRKVAHYEDLTEDEVLELSLMTQRLIRVIRAVSHPDAFNIGFNLGSGAGGSVSEHVHQHVVPRWIGDANFITLFANTKVLPQTLRETRRLLSEEWVRQTADRDSSV